MEEKEVEVRRENKENRGERTRIPQKFIKDNKRTRGHENKLSKYIYRKKDH